MERETLVLVCSINVKNYTHTQLHLHAVSEVNKFLEANARKGEIIRFYTPAFLLADIFSTCGVFYFVFNKRRFVYVGFESFANVLRGNPTPIGIPNFTRPDREAEHYPLFDKIMFGVF